MKIGLLICTFNRPQYLRQCLASVSASDLSQVATVLIVDDCSNDPDTRRLIDDFDLEGVELIKAFAKENRSIKGSLLFGCDLLFNTCDVVTNLDGDAIVTKDAFNRLLELREIFPGYILSGFNCSTKNKDRSVRHKILEQGMGWNKKYSVGGINMMFDNIEYLQVIKPALQKCIKGGGNWDHQACIISNQGYGKSIVVLEPSCVQHIGIQSSMGHSSGGEPPDVADDFIDDRPANLHPDAWTGKIMLENVTLVAADCVNINRVFKAYDKCLEKLMFGDVKIFTSLQCDQSRCENIIPIDRINTKEEYSWFIMKELAKHIKTSHLLIFQHDGYILNPDAWDSEWLQYDYIGAPWEWYPDNRVGNGGFSLRSTRLMKIIAFDQNLIPVTDGLNTHKEEDHCICRIYRKYLEDTYDIKFAPLEVARKFSIEGYRSLNRTWTNEFGFHGSGLTNIKP